MKSGCSTNTGNSKIFNKNSRMQSMKQNKLSLLGPGQNDIREENILDVDNTFVDIFT